ncbi:MAG: hypothetical protein HC896_01415 [Bacteroidales bacterium]|nr:hypothetical protein [Bacteroidales bacterium]
MEEDTVKRYAAHFVNVTNQKDPMFIVDEKNDETFWSTSNYKLDTLSPAKDLGNMEITNKVADKLSMDIYGVSRLTDKAPDVGAAERVE